MLWIILITLIVAGVCTNNFTPLKVFGKIMAWFFGIILGLCLFVTIWFAFIEMHDDRNNKKQQEVDWEHVKQTPLIHWACDTDGRQLYLAERPEYVYQCSTGKLIATSLSSKEPYWCEKPFKQVNHWRFCKPNIIIKNSNYSHLLGN